MFWKKTSAPPDCPRCRTALGRHTLTTAVEQWEIEIDACRACGGVWLETHDMAADARANLLLDQALLVLNTPGAAKVSYVSAAACPACRAALYRGEWSHSEVELDQCPRCEGLWFDGGEIRAVQRHLGRVRHLKGL